MPLRLDIKRKLTARSDRVKSVDLHPTEPWMVVGLYSGSVLVWNRESQTIVKSFELCDLPVRAARFVSRKHWIIAGADDMQIHVLNYNTLERVHKFEAHADYIRCIAVHPTQTYILTSSDDMLIKLWDWDRKWTCSQVFEGHTHYVMQVVINPKDNNRFASASLDRTVKVWQLGSRTPNFTLEGHEKGVNCVEYYSGGDKPYLISGADDHLVKIWDYQNKTCVQTLEGHTQNVTCVSLHPELPIILTGSEDGTIRLWHSNTFRQENTLNYGMERVWCMCVRPGSNSVALGYDEGSIIIKLGREEPAMSMDSGGKVTWARHFEVQQANLKVVGGAETRDGERLQLAVKDMGSCDIYPQTIQHSPNGRFVAVCGDGEFIIYTAVALRNKSFGTAQEFVWSHDSSQYAIREGTSTIKIFKNFKEKMVFKPAFGSEGIFGGFLLGVRSNSGLTFYDWESSELIRRIEIQPKHIFWSGSGDLVCIATDESFFVLRYLPDMVSAAQENKEKMTEGGIEDAFEVMGEVHEVVRTGVWVGDCFIYTSSVDRLNYYVGGEIITIAHMDRTMYLLGYIPKDDRLYLGDKELNVVSYSLLLSVLEYQTAIMRRDFTTADKVLPTIPREQRTRVADFLEKQGFRQQALAVSTDPEHKFELALQLEEVGVAYQLALEAESEHKWKQLAELATTKCQFSLAQKCLHQAQDYGGLLLLATASGNADMMGELAEGAERSGKTNVAFLTYFMQGRLDKCLELLIKTDRLPEAAFLSRTYLPSHVSRVVSLWKESLSKVNQKAADALADPMQYDNLFPGLQRTLLAEQYLKETHVGVRPAAEYPFIMPNEDCNVLEESMQFVSKEAVSEPEEVMKSINENLPASRPVLPPAAVEEETSIEQELLIESHLIKEKESLPNETSYSHIPTTEEHVEPEPYESVPSDELASKLEVEALKDPVTTAKEASVSGEEEILEAIIKISSFEIVESSLIKDVRPSVEESVQEMLSAADAVSAACDCETSASEVIIGKYEDEGKAVATEAAATEDVLLPTSLTVFEVSESVTGQGPDYKTQETYICSDAAAIVDAVADKHVSKPASLEELSSLETTALSLWDAPVPLQTRTHVAFDLLLDPLEHTVPVLEPVSVPEAVQKKLLPANSQPEDTLEAVLETEVSSPAAPPTESSRMEEAWPQSAEQPAEDLEEEISGEL
ncbi:coatomer subunit beta'-like [Betta splendens]|uniref:Coatomer subunit beta' n=1 Tax=Betta splendens TaxID=158456 RepID=A0A9W2Y878_BETSP|nr:coatomer subunit beta'-like [Betta splendens]